MQKPKTTYAMFALASAVLATSAGTAQAVNATWNNAAGGEWGTSSTSAQNWSGGNPGLLAGDTATISLVTGTPYVIYKNVNFPSGGSLAAFTMDSPDAILEMPQVGSSNVRSIFLATNAVADVNRGTIRVNRGSGSNAMFAPRVSGEAATLKIGSAALIDVQPTGGIAPVLNAATVQLTQQNGTIQVGVNGSGPYFQGLTINNSFTNAGTIKLSNQKTGAPTDGANPDSNTILNVLNGTLTNTGTIQVLAGASDGQATVMDGFGLREINRRDLNLVLNNQGTLDVQNAGLRAATLGVGAGGSHVNSGNIIIAADTTLALIASNTLTNQAAGTIGGNGTLDVSASGASLANVGALSPGDSAGTFTIVGGFTSTDIADVNIELGGTTAGLTYDQLIVTGGTAGLDGDLNVSFLDSFVPASSDVFVILSGLNEGTFDNVIGGKLNLGNGYAFDVTYNSASVELSNYALVPEPTSMAVLGLGLGALARRRRS